MFIQYYGTGAAVNANVDTTHFVIYEWEKRLYVDAWWWMSLGQRVLRGEITLPKYLFMTHCHTDHLMWLPFLIRVIWDGTINIFLTKKLAEKVKQIMYIVWRWERYEKKIETNNIVLHLIDQNSEIDIYDWNIKPINLHSKKVEQYWFQLKWSWKHIVFFWDEAVDVLNRNDLDSYMWCDWLLCEAFCAQQHKKKMDPGGKAHVTSLEAWNIAKQIDAKNVILSHIAEDIELDRSKQIDEMKMDMHSVYDGNVVIPKDGDVIEL